VKTKIGRSTVLLGGVGISPANAVLAIPRLDTDRNADGSHDNFSIKITLPSNATAGFNQVKVIDAGGTSATATIEIEGRSVAISPTSGPPGTVDSIQGAGFPPNRASSVSNTASINPAFGSVTITGLFTTSTGELPGSDTITIPAVATPSVATLKVSIRGSDGLDSTGAAKFTVTPRELTLAPNSGPRGTEVIVTGSTALQPVSVTPNSALLSRDQRSAGKYVSVRGANTNATGADC
jgi:hypothetical protein